MKRRWAIICSQNILLSFNQYIYMHFFLPSCVEYVPLTSSFSTHSTLAVLGDEYKLASSSLCFLFRCCILINAFLLLEYAAYDACVWKWLCKHDVEEVNATMKDINEAYIVSRPIFEAGTLRMLWYWCWSFPSGGSATLWTGVVCVPIDTRVQYLWCGSSPQGAPERGDTGDVRGATLSSFLIQLPLGRQMWLMDLKFGAGHLPADGW